MAQEIADSTLLDTWSSGGNIVEPDISKIIEGWQLGEQPPHEYMNWLQNTFGSKLNHILKNGVASWNNTTQYLAGATVQHTGNVWLCKITNSNSEPADANANWKRIITVESLNTLLDGYIPSDLSGETSKTTPIDADLIPLSDSASSFGIKKLSWANVKATLKTYFDTLYPKLTPTIANGIISFNSTTNEISGTGVGDCQIGDVLLISGATDTKNNTTFTVDVVNNANSIIVNQAHANKGTSRNVATRVNDANVTIKLLSKHYNTDSELGRDWIDVKAIRAFGTTYTPNLNRDMQFKISFALPNTGENQGGKLLLNGVDKGYIFASSALSGTTNIAGTGFGTITRQSTYLIQQTGTATIQDFWELR